MAEDIAYIRVSSDQQADYGCSMEAQQNIITNYCKTYDLPIPRFIVDDGKSGRQTNKREGIQEVIEMVEKKQVLRLYTYNISRLFRNVIDTLNFFDLMEKREVQFHSIYEKIDTSTAIGKFFITQIAAINRLMSDKIGEDTAAVLLSKKSNLQTYSAAPFGLKIVDRVVDAQGNVLESGKLVPHETEAPIVKMIFDRKTYPAEITNFLNDMGAKPKKADKFSRAAIVKILNNKMLYEKANII